MSKTVLITGASSGIGKAAAHHFARQGWNVAATMRNPALETELTQYPNLQVFALDVTDSSSIEAAFSAAQNAFGAIDVVVNNAGYGVDGIFEAMTDETIHKQFETNVLGLMRVTRAAISAMRPRKSGVIIQITSMGGRIAFPLYSIYHGTKWAVEGFSESLQFELKGLGIRVKVVEPGPIKTDFYDRSREFVATDIPEYQALLKNGQEINVGFGQKGASPDAVARVIFKAANHRGARLRFAVG